MSTHDDELIDRAAQAMTRGEPSDRLRHAVRARIEASRPFDFAQGRRLWIPMAAAAVIVLSVLAWRTMPGPRSEPVPATRVASAPHAVPPVALEPASQPVVAPRSEVPVRAAAGPMRTPQRTLVVDPLVIEPISVPLLAVDSSPGVMPIEIQPLQIEMLQPQ